MLQGSYAYISLYTVLLRFHTFYVLVDDLEITWFTLQINQ